MKNTFLNHFENRDLDHIAQKTFSMFETLNGAEILLTGGTGFFGKWFLASLIHAKNEMGLNYSVTIPTRNVHRFLQRFPQLANTQNITFVQANITDLQSIKNKPFTHIIHGAADTIIKSQQEDELRYQEQTQGIDQVLSCASTYTQKFLYISSGAVYDFANNTQSVNENAPLLENKTNLYAIGKRNAEQKTRAHFESSPAQAVIARAFAFLGPHMTLNEHFAVGNFIEESLQNKSITIKSDGKAYRSYMYSADLVIWLWTLLLKGQSGEIYNVGSDASVSISQLAKTVSSLLSPAQHPKILGETSDTAKPYYIPDISKAKSQLGLDIWIPLEEAILRTANWAKQAKEQR